MDHDPLVKSAEELAQSLSPVDLDHTLGRITAAAVEVLPDVDFASITIRHEDGTLETVAPTDDALLAVDARQYELREGPCYEAATDAVHVTSSDLEHDQRFPEYALSAVAAGIRAQAGIRLFDAPDSQGALNLYSRSVGAFGDLDRISALFAHQSGAVIKYAQEIKNLQDAIATRELVGRAVGIAMERYELTDQRAFALLTRLAQRHTVDLPAVAQAVVDASEGRADN